MRFLALLLFPLLANAQYDGPGVETCRLYAQRQLMRDANTARSIVIERDQSLIIERYTRKVGNQFVSSILTGNGAVVFANAPSAELAFICLLADDKRAVFFEWLPRRDASAMTQCLRDDTTRASPRSCLQTLVDSAVKAFVFTLTLPRLVTVGKLTSTRSSTSSPGLPLTASATAASSSSEFDTSISPATRTTVRPQTW